MTLVQLRYVLAVAQHGSFRLAAEHCHITQPTLSMQIQKLEEDLGVTLFDRSRQPVVTTAIGKKVVEQAQTAIQEFDRIQEVIKELKGDVSGPFHVGIIPTLAPYLLPRFVPDFIKTHPKVELTIEELQTHQIIDKILSDELDAAILVTPLKRANFVERPLFWEPFYLYASLGHSILEHQKVQQDLLNREEILLLSDGHCFRSQAIRLCQARPQERGPKNFSFEGGSLETLKKMVDQGQGYTLLPHLAVVDLLSENERRRVREFTKPQPIREVSLVARRNVVKRTIIDVLERAILESLPSELKSSPAEGAIVPIE